MSKYNLHMACEIVPLILEDVVGLKKPSYLRMAADEFKALADLFEEQAKFIEENPEHSAEHMQALILMELAKYQTKH